MNTDPLIQRYLNFMINIFLKEGGWRYTHSVYLVGGFARDEGTFDVKNTKICIYNDIDILIITKRKDPLTLLRVNNLQKIINNSGFGFSVDIIVESEVELQSPSPIIRNYDIGRYHKLLWGSDYFAIEKSILALQPSSIDPSDALQLLFNRLASLLIGFEILSEPEYNESYLQVQLSKPLLAIMATLLILEKKYVVKVKEQLEIIKTEKINHNNTLWRSAGNEEILSLIETAVNFKLAPKSHHFKPFNETICVIAKHYKKYMTYFMITHYNLPLNSGEDYVIQEFENQQPVQNDILSPGWWASMLRRSNYDLSWQLPKRGCHLQVYVYKKHFKWISKFLQNRGKKTNSFLFEKNDRLMSMLTSLINLWKVNGYGCKIK